MHWEEDLFPKQSFFIALSREACPGGFCTFATLHLACHLSRLIGAGTVPGVVIVFTSGCMHNGGTLLECVHQRYPVYANSQFRHQQNTMFTLLPLRYERVQSIIPGLPQLRSDRVAML